MSTTEVYGRTRTPGSSSRTLDMRLVAATVAGNTLEIYDFVVYAFFSVYIGKAFFPTTDPSTSLLLSVGVFGVGFIARPLGAYFIGRLADRAGRRLALLLTIFMITIGTMGLAFTPSYASIGIAAPLIVVACRLIQGFALGGEVGPSTSFLVEIAPDNTRGWWGSWQLASQGLAIVIAGVAGLITTHTLSAPQMQAWGWRIPLTLGVLMVPVAIYLRRSMPETLEEEAHTTGGDASPTLGKHRRTILLGILLILAPTVFTYLGTYMTTYAISVMKMDPATSMWATLAFGLSTFVFSLLGGWLSDRHGRKPVMFWPRLAIALLCVPLFAMLQVYPNAFALIFATTVIAGLTALSGSASLVAIPEMLPARIRAAGMSISYALTVSIFGGTTQFVATWLLKATGNALSPAWYVGALGIVSALAVLSVKETAPGHLPS
jgi:MFS family permease